ncbi:MULTISPECIES: rod shape-determining protein MreC [Roseateles]|uniref:Cell shape-determining protein MreC n=1 Tax=Roseateles albus TaxID=2987525 RepID=A0ABT5K9C3_9BURK|nr:MULTISPECIES: rod shape-determining protein MreC [Roseateles]MCV2358657.1 rod shape-determining protein MreC [Paucibacter sp. TC2R-5]MDC8770012.1 rod shape-determining protein MreC [Roseateles albus]
MSLGPFDRDTPPFFRQGASALTKLLLCAALALFLMVADARFKLTAPARASMALALQPLQTLLLAPVDAWETLQDYLRGTESAREAENLARRQLVQQAERLSRAEQLQAENQRLRALLELRPAVQVSSVSAEVLYEATDPYSRRVVIDRGSRHGVQPGAPVINDKGVLGQVTRVYGLSAEVTLLNDKDAAIPVLNSRTQQRNAAFGRSDGNGMELRFLAANADVKEGDVLVTSGLDGVYPPGLPVARVSLVERRGDTSFASVGLQPIAQADSARHVLVLQPLAQHEAAQAEAAAAAAADAASAAASKSARKAAAAAAKGGSK